MSLDVDRLREFVSASGLLSDVVRLGPLDYPEGCSAGLRGTLELGARVLGIRVLIPDRFPLQLPLVCVEQHETLGAVPHVTQVGSICYHESEGSVHSLRHLEQTVVDALRLALRTLSQGLAGNRGHDFGEEAEWWWSRQPNVFACMSWIEPGDRIKRIRRVRIIGEFVAVVDSTRSSKAFDESETLDEGLYVPLRRGGISSNPHQILQSGGLRQFLRARIESKDWRYLARNASSTTAFLVLGVPRPSNTDDVALLGLDFSRTPINKILEGTSSNDHDAALRPFLLPRMDRPRLLGRGGAAVNLSDLSVGLVGCGSVGGYVADALARTGVGRLTLIDPDTLEPGNAYRHVCGILGMLAPKVSALQVSILQKLPFTQVDIIYGRIEEFLDQSHSRPIDLYVIAVGNPTLSRWINRELVARRKRAVFTWLEPLVGSSRVDLQACKLEYSIVSPK